MLKEIIITNYRGKSVTYSMSNVSMDEESGMIITEVEGLGPVKANINMTELVTADGGIFNSSRLSTRNIVITALFTYATTIEEARLKSYAFFPIGHKVKIQIITDTRNVETEGYVESNEPVIFSDKCSCQISILCESAYFLSSGKNGTTTTTFSGINNLFEFPFENDGLEPAIEFSEIVNLQENNVNYQGDAETGIIINLHAIGTVENIRIYNLDTGERMFVDTDKLETLTGNKMIAGDDITINTMKGQKSIYLLRGGVSTNILNVLGKDADWFTLSKGDNLFTFVCEEGTSNLQFSIKSQVVYEGI